MNKNHVVVEERHLSPKETRALGWRRALGWVAAPQSLCLPHVMQSLLSSNRVVPCSEDVLSQRHCAQCPRWHRGFFLSQLQYLLTDSFLSGSPSFTQAVLFDIYPMVLIFNVSKWEIPLLNRIALRHDNIYQSAPLSLSSFPYQGSDVISQHRSTLNGGMIT